MDHGKIYQHLFVPILEIRNIKIEVDLTSVSDAYALNYPATDKSINGGCVKNKRTKIINMNAYKRYKNRLEKFLQTERGKRFINFAYSIGAAIVILGAMFKLLHFPFGNELLFIGMVTEVIVFTLSAFDTPIRDYNWDKVFPSLTSDNSEQHEKTNRGVYTNQTTLNQSTIDSPKFTGTNIDLSPQANEYAKQMENLKTETEKMAQQLKELNEVYARMLKAMSSNRDY